MLVFSLMGNGTAEGGGKLNIIENNWQMRSRLYNLCIFKMFNT